MGIEILQTLEKGGITITDKTNKLPTILKSWTSPFTALSVIINRETPYHRDNGSCHAWMDILLTVGDYQDGRIEFPGLGFRLKYDSGTLVALTGRLVRHGANFRGHRACIAYYMRQNVSEAVGAGTPSWMNTNLYYTK